MKAVGYIRLSFKDQSKYSMDEQEAAIVSYCALHKLELVEIFKDNGQKSSSFNRLNFKALELFVKKHKGEIRYLIIMEHDRFSRDLSEALLKINRFEDDFGLKVVSVDEPLDIDPSDPSSFISRAFKYATANAELLNIRARTKRGIRRAKLEGRFINKAPFGYRNDRDLSGKGILIIEIEEAAIVKDIFSRFLSGISMGMITDLVRPQGFYLTGHNAVGRLLANCIYAGLVRAKKEDGTTKYIKALHEAIIPEVDFWLVQEMLGKNKPSKINISRDFLLKGLLKCRCGRYMTAGWSRGRRQYYLYYHCRIHSSPNVPGRIVHAQFEEVLKETKLSPEQLAIIQKKVDVRMAVLLRDEQYQITARRKMIKELDNKLESLEEHLIDKNIDVVTFKKWSERYNIEHKKLEDNILDLEKFISERNVAVHDAMSEMRCAYDICKRCSTVQRQLLLKLIFRYGFTVEGDQLSTYKICSPLSHNTRGLLNKRLMYIDQKEAITNVNEAEYFLNFIAELMIDKVLK